MLTDDDKKIIWSKFMSDVGSREEKFGNLSKHDIKDVIDAIDVWIENNSASFNQALPEVGRTQLTLKQKVEIFFMVARRRWEVT